MSNVVGMNEFVGLAGGDTYCWLCQKPMSVRALFCPYCGTIQPVRDIDHFARLGLECRLDVDTEVLERQYTTLSGMLVPERFLIRGIGERGHAAKQLEALKESYETLREPLRRGRYWLQLNEKEFTEDGTANPLVSELRRELTDAAEPSHCDRVAQRAGHALEQGVMLLMQALRGGNWRQANQTLSQIDGVESILDEVRERRSGMTQARE
jgi:molecular chaperone HscB